MTRRIDSADAIEWHPRVDRGTLLRPVVRTDGSLLVEGYAAREGVLEYRRADGSVFREYVPAETLRASAKGLARCPVTLEHPREDVSPDNVERLGVGDTDGEVTVEDDGFVRVKLAVRRRDAVDDVRSGKRRELSPGYRVRLDPTPGVHPVHGRYDAVQIERQYNHLAVVSAARGGRDIRMRVDAADVPTATTLIERRADSAQPGTRSHGVAMPEYLRLLLALGIEPPRADASEAEIVNLCVSKVGQLKDEAKRNALELAGRADSAGRDLATANGRADAAEAAARKAEADLAAEKGRADAAEAELAKVRAAEQDRADAAEQKELEALAKFLKVDTKRVDGLSALRVACATSIFGAALPQSDDAYVKGILGVGLRQMAQHADSAGREAGRQAWQANQDATGTEQRADTQGAQGGQRSQRRSPSAGSMARYRAAFTEGRS